MKSQLYTNTGKVGSIVGLVITTLAVSYVAQNSTKIVDSTLAAIKTGVRKGEKFINDKVTEEVEVWSTLPNGEKYNTGMKVRVNKFAKRTTK